MMTILNYLSFFLIFLSLGIAVAHPRIQFPIHVEIIMFIIAIGAAAMLINAIVGKDLYGYKEHADIWMRLGLGALIMRFIYDYLKEHKIETDSSTN